MGRLLKVGTLALMTSFITLAGTAKTGVLKSLDNELNSIVEKTDSYLVTVKGQDPWRNLIATGILYNKEGYIITSAHAYGGDAYQVTFKNGDTYPASKIGVDHQTGLAVLKIESDDLKPPQIGDSKDLKDGSWIIVVGNSYGTPAAVNFGIFEGRTDENFLKLGVGVSPGSSGGAVLDIDGKLVGILIAREDDSDDSDSYLAKSRRPYSMGIFNLARGSSGRAIAVPIEEASNVAEQVIETGTVRRGFLGISQKNLSGSGLEDLKVDHGVMVVDVADDSPAQRAGLEKGDIITDVDKDPISRTSDLYNLVRSKKPGEEIAISYSRAGETRSTRAVLAEAQDDTLFGVWRLKEFYPNLSVSNLIEMPLKRELEEKVDRLEKDLSTLKKELEKLKDGLKD